VDVCKLCEEGEESPIHWWQRCPGVRPRTDWLKGVEVPILEKILAWSKLESIREAMDANAEWLREQGLEEADL